MSGAANCGAREDSGQDFPYLQKIQFNNRIVYLRTGKMSRIICDFFYKIVQQGQTHLLALFRVKLNS